MRDYFSRTRLTLSAGLVHPQREILVSKQLILTVAPPGAGKSTLAKEHVANGYVRISQDVSGRQHLALFEEAVKDGRDIVVDRLNFSKKQRSRYLDVAKANGYSTKIIVLHESYQVCLERCLNRKDHETIKDGDAAQSALNMFFTKYERVEDQEADSVERRWPEGPKASACWIDIDGTLSDASAREHYLQKEKKDWAGFYSELGNDPVNEWCRALANATYYPYVKVLICTARSREYQEQTERWLHDRFVAWDEIHMRYLGDRRKDFITKEVMYEFEVKTKFNLLFAVEDRITVIDMLRKHGVTVLDCRGEAGKIDV
jgi:predicted kinase